MQSEALLLGLAQYIFYSLKLCPTEAYLKAIGYMLAVSQWPGSPGQKKLVSVSDVSQVYVWAGKSRTVHGLVCFLNFCTIPQHASCNLMSTFHCQEVGH